MLRTLEVPTTLCASFGGESGAVVRSLVDRDGLGVVSVEVEAANGAYVHDRRDGERREVAARAGDVLSRHDRDDLYTAAVASGLDADICVLAGYEPSSKAVPPDDYRRLVADLRANGTTTVADLSGPLRDAVLDGGVDVVKTSDEDLVEDGLVDSDPTDPELLDLMESWAGRGIDHVVVTRSARGTLVLTHGRVARVTAPHLRALDHRGAGDSVTAGIVAGLARDLSFLESVRLGVAAAALNVTRHGLATGRAEDIERLVTQVEVEDLPPEERSR